MSIHLIFGPMFSGKSTELHRLTRKYNIAKKKCLIINHASDNRYSDDEFTITHDNQKMPAFKCTNLSQIGDQYKKYDVVGIDEGQFFETKDGDLYKLAKKYADEGKVVIIAALDYSTVQKGPFDVVKLIAVADTVNKLVAVCSVCDADAIFTNRFGNGKNYVGGLESYQALCRKCTNSCNFI